MFRNHLKDHAAPRASAAERPSRRAGVARTRSALLSALVVAALLFTLHTLRLSDASVTAASHNSANVFVSGTLSHDNDQNNKAMLSAGSLTPGHSVSATMILTGTGSVAGAFELKAADLVDTSTVDPGLSDVLTLKIEDVTVPTTPVTLWPVAPDPVPDVVSDFDSTNLGTIAPGDVRKYRITLSYPNGPVNKDLAGAVMTLVLEVDGVSQ